MATRQKHNNKKKHPSEQLLINEIQLLLAEKRTYYALLRTGLAVFTVPLSVIAVLAATAEYHNLFARLELAIVIIGGLSIISLIGLSIFYRSEARIKKINRLIDRIEKENKRIAEIVV